MGSAGTEPNTGSSGRGYERSALDAYFAAAAEEESQLLGRIDELSARERAASQGLDSAAPDVVALVARFDTLRQELAQRRRDAELEIAFARAEAAERTSSHAGTQR